MTVWLCRQHPGESIAEGMEGRWRNVDSDDPVAGAAPRLHFHSCPT